MAIKNLDAVASAIGMDVDTLKAAIESEDAQSIEIPEMVRMTQTDFDERLENTRKESKTAGVEIAIKEARSKLGLEFQGKTMENLLTAYETKLKADFAPDAEPDKKVAELTKDIETLRGNLAKKDDEINEIKTNFKKESVNRTINDKIIGAVPENTIIPAGDIAQLFRTKVDVDINDEGAMIFKKNGEVLKNPTTLSPMGLNDVLGDFVSPYLKKASGGGGGDDEPGNLKAGSFEAFVKEMSAKGVDSNSLAFSEEMQKRIADKTLNV